MATHTTLTSLFDDIADAIREKDGSTASIIADNFPTKIRAISTGFETVIEVTTKAGASVTATNGGTTLRGTANSSGVCTLKVTKAGTWSVKATLSGQTAGPVSVYVQDQYEAKVNFISTTLNNNDWKTIADVASSGDGENYWSVGDQKQIIINGRIGSKTFSNLAINAFIVGFNHNKDFEGTNRIHFQIGKVSGKLCGLYDDNYADDVGWSSGGSGNFIMNLSTSNSGGWKNSYIRKTILGNDGSPSNPPQNSFLAALPQDLRSVIKGITKYSDNDGLNYNSESSVTQTVDYLWLMSEFEITGSRSFANPYEKNKQMQYQYYKSGNSRIGYKYNKTSSPLFYWTRSPYSSDSFCRIGSSGEDAYQIAFYSLAILVCFGV